MDDRAALEDLQYIRKVIEDSKRALVYNGIDYIVWGILVIIGLTATYVLVASRIYFNYFWIWLALVAAGWMFSLFSSKKSKASQPRTFSDKIIGSVWLSSGITMSILGFIGPVTRAVNPVFISPLLSVVLGTAYFVTGNIFESRWFTYLSFGWWAGAIVMFFFPGIHSLIIMALMMLLFQTIPGIILYKIYKQKMAV
ncbi:MAG: hypothetical protein ACM3QX_05855 [Syntrophomonadaceae bacterium]